VRPQIIFDMKVYILVLWDLKPCDIVGDYRPFRGTCCLCCQGKAFYCSSASGLCIFLSLGFYSRDWWDKVIEYCAVTKDERLFGENKKDIS